MKYYIATSSLNIDNILSSESIAPVCFYPQRSFGYKTFEKVEGITLDNSLLLFDKIPRFTINDSERENDPMIIEIESDEQLSDNISKTIEIIKDCFTYTYGKTIYLNPFTCRLLFFNERALRLAELKCDSSISCKMGGLYALRLIDKSECFEWDDKYLLQESEPTDIHEEIANDDRINRGKGYLFGYLMGFKNSVSHDTAQIRKLYKRIYDIFSSIISNNGLIVESFKNELHKLSEQFMNIDPKRKQLNELYNENILSKFETEKDRQIFCELLKKYNLEFKLKNQFCIDEGFTPFNFPDLNSFNNVNSWKKYRNDLQIYIKDIIDKDLTSKEERPLGQIVHLINGLVVDFPGNKALNLGLYTTILNEMFLCWDGITVEQVRLEKQLLSDDVTRKVKSYLENIGVNWPESSDKEYFTSLRKNIAIAVPFDLMQSSDPIEVSIAAFLLKGEDLSSLYNFLEMNGVGDLSFALGLWGAACGYANMPASSTKKIIARDEVFSKLYKEIYRQSIGSIDDVQEFLPKFKYSNFEKTVVIESKINQESSKANKVRNMTCDQILGELVKASIIIKNNSPYKKLKEYLTNHLGEINDNWIKGIDDLHINKSKDIMIFFHKNKVIVILDKSHLNKKEEPKLPFNENNEPKIFYRDDNARDLIEDLKYPSNKVKKRFIACLSEFQTDYRDNGYFDNRGDDKTNSKVIDHFIKWLYSKGKDKTPKFTSKEISDLLREEIKERLLDVYKD